MVSSGASTVTTASVRVRARAALAGLRILDVAQPVPDETPDIHLIVQDPCAAAAIAVQRARAPGAAARELECAGR